ncbi:S41 family peptidase, partial [Candidatus Ruminimicrobium bovinum]|uniref:S41 family peptidase n=1 Tax=Candidatus Ruminimicrobium bovinum TaxID=3242779 RepID=UPI0039B96F2A
CTSDEDISSEVPDLIHSENIYLEFNRWIYAQMNHDYLWRKDMPDSLSCDYDLAPVSFFKTLLSPKDRFSYCETNNSYNPDIEEYNLGYEYQKYVLYNGSDFVQVLFVTNPELKKKGLKRGDIIIPQNNKNIIVKGKLINSTILPIDTLESALPFDNTQTVYIDSIYVYNSLKIGYLCYLKFEEITDLVPAIKKFYDAKVDELILDLRYNPGGYVNTCKYLSNSIVNERGYDGIFQQCTYNDILTKIMEEETGSGTSVNYFTTPDNGLGIIGSPMYGLNLKRVFVLTSKNSASASEAAIISMRPYMDVVIIGEQTYGKGVGSWTIRDNRYKYQLQPITMRYHNALMETTPDDGIAVDYYIPDGFSTSKKELGDTSEPLLAKALKLITDTDKTYTNKVKSNFYNNDKSSFVEENGLPSFARFNLHFLNTNAPIPRK